MDAHPTTQKKYLGDICVIRIILIFLLITYHSLCPFTSAYWDNPQGGDIPVYYWASRLSYSCLLETFVFISGVVLGYQVYIKGKSILTYRYLIKGKIKRLLIPSILFSIFYYFIFLDFANDSIWSSAYKILEGTGHLWFLPMLFWCFVLIFILSLLKRNEIKIIICLAILSLISIKSLPLRFHLSLYYMLFFYTGYCVGKGTLNLTKYFTKK